MIAVEPLKPEILDKISSFAPVNVIEVELSQPLSDIACINEKNGQHYERALCLVRLHSQPLGKVELELGKEGLSAHQLAELIWHNFSSQIIRHLQQDELSIVDNLDVSGLAYRETPRCIVEREQFMTDAPFVSIIVPTQDRPDRIETCLCSLLALEYPRYEIIVVDNAPATNATADFIEQNYRGESQVRYVREERRGASWARNCGIQVAQGEFIAFCDDDVVVDRFWLVELIKAFHATENVVCVTGLILPLQLETQAQVWFEEFGGFTQEFSRRIFDMKDHHPKTPLYPYAGSFGVGANMAFSATFLRSINGFDTALGAGSIAHGGEDLTAFYQAIAQGYALVYEPAALEYHLHRRDYAALCKQIFIYGTGYTAFLTKIIFDNPKLLFDLGIKVPYGFLRLLNPRSPKHSKKSHSFPKELSRLELKGMFNGPFAYLRSRRFVSSKQSAIVSSVK